MLGLAGLVPREKRWLLALAVRGLTSAPPPAAAFGPTPAAP